MSGSSKYSRLVQYLRTHYTFHAGLGQFNLGERENTESEAKWSLISDIMDFVDNLDLEDLKNDKIIEFPSSLDDGTLNTETPLPGGMGEDHISFSSDSEPTYFSDIYGLVSGTLPKDDDK